MEEIVGSNSRVNLDRAKANAEGRLVAIKAKLAESGLDAAARDSHVTVRQIRAELRSLNGRLKAIDTLDAQNAKRLTEKENKAKAAAAPKEDPKKGKGKGKGKGKAPTAKKKKAKPAKE